MDNGTNFYMILYHWKYLCNTGLTLPSRWGRWPAEESILTNCIASNFPGVNILYQRTTLLQRSLLGQKFTCLQGDGSFHQLCCGTSAFPLWIMSSEEEILAPQKQGTTLQPSQLCIGFCPESMAGALSVMTPDIPKYEPAGGCKQHSSVP